ncbi:hypothetical protein [Flavobacterium hydatis]|uniref:Uncharacterized protein n=1 Tax=Flavobacterium hydatis TaxID=991 RepID=A0A086A388_FLAHY|nr:hypothetical protein [Flavobacterium hydatis]KFF11152.1 hypothetical protein IW20_19610 [Flavobacterium hydatis]OXA97810.1 hypothetical protein B0A62_02850 [Flavobacterium hydatis]
MTYKDEVLELLKKTDINEGDIFDFGETPHEHEFAETYQFYRGILTWASKYDVKSSSIFFQNDTSPNARAKTFNKHGVIAITSGLMIRQINDFLKNEELDKKLKERFEKIHPFLDNPIHVLMYQQVQHSTFYHELGHLIQQSEELQNWMQETSTSNNFSLTRHKLELDADSFSALSLAAHIQQYGFKIFGETIDTEKMELLVELFSATVLLYFLTFSNAKREIYYEENSHPHPLVRIINVLLIISDYLGKSPKLSKKGIIINPRKIIRGTIDLVEKIESEIFKNEKSDDLNIILSKNKTEIINYFTKLRAHKVEDCREASDVWNEKIPT